MMSEFNYSSRDLHKELNSELRHCVWVNRAIDALSLEEGIDYIRVSKREYKFAEEVADKIKSYNKDIKTLVEENVKADKALKVLERVSWKIEEGFEVIDGDVYIKSQTIAEMTGKLHKNVIRDIREEVKKLQIEMEAFTDTKDELSSSPSLVKKSEIINNILNGVKESSYKDSSGKENIAYLLNEAACMQMMLKYSAFFRATFIYKFQKQREDLINYQKVLELDKIYPQSKRGHVYVISNGLGALKIGVAKDPDNRLKQFQTGSCEPLEIIFSSIACSNYYEIEKAAHEHFKDKRASGEWFKDISLQDIVKFLLDNNFILLSTY